MATVRKIKTHESFVWSHDCLVYLQVGRGARQTLNIDAPLLIIQVECLEGTSLAGQLNGVDMLVSTVVSSTWVTLRILVAHGRSESIEDGAGGDVLGGDEDDGFSLTLDL